MFTLSFYCQNNSHSKKFTFNRARSTLYRSRWRKFWEKELLNNNIFSTLSLCTPRGLVVTLWPGALKVLSSITGNTYFSFFFLFNFPFTYCSFVSLFSLSFFKFINFLPYCPFSLSTSCRFPEVLREVLRFTHF